MTLSIAITVWLFAGLGMLAARLFALPLPRRTWFLLVVAVVVGSVVGTDTRLLSVFGLVVRLNWAITSCCLGILAGLWACSRRVAAAWRTTQVELASEGRGNAALLLAFAPLATSQQSSATATSTGPGGQS